MGNTRVESESDAGTVRGRTALPTIDALLEAGDERCHSRAADILESLIRNGDINDAEIDSYLARFLHDETPTIRSAGERLRATVTGLREPWGTDEGLGEA